MVWIRIGIKSNLLIEGCGMDIGLLNGQSVGKSDIPIQFVSPQRESSVLEVADHFVLTVFSWCSVCCTTNRVLRGTSNTSFLAISSRITSIIVNPYTQICCKPLSYKFR